jgi:hypothetical protein
MATLRLHLSEPTSSYSQISNFLEVLNLVLDALSDPTMHFRPNLKPHKHSPLNYMARNLNDKDLTRATLKLAPYSVNHKINIQTSLMATLRLHLSQPTNSYT